MNNVLYIKRPRMFRDSSGCTGTGKQSRNTRLVRQAVTQEIRQAVNHQSVRQLQSDRLPVSRQLVRQAISQSAWIAQATFAYQDG